MELWKKRRREGKDTEKERHGRGLWDIYIVSLSHGGRTFVFEGDGVMEEERRACVMRWFHGSGRLWR